MASASPTSAHATRARLTLHLLVVVGRWRSRAFGARTPLAVSMGMGYRPLINPNTQHVGVSVGIAQGLSESIGPMLGLS